MWFELRHPRNPWFTVRFPTVIPFRVFSVFRGDPLIPLPLPFPIRVLRVFRGEPPNHFHP